MSPIYTGHLPQAARAASKASVGSGFQMPTEQEELDLLGLGLGGLAWAGNVADQPRQAITSLILESLGGMELDEYKSGADIIQQATGDFFTQKEGEVDLVDVLGFLGEVATDPLTYVGGLGIVRNLAGRLAKKSGKSLGEKSAAMAALRARDIELDAIVDTAKREKLLRRGLDEKFQALATDAPKKPIHTDSRLHGYLGLGPTKGAGVGGSKGGVGIPTAEEAISGAKPHSKRLRELVEVRRQMGGREGHVGEQLRSMLLERKTLKQQADEANRLQQKVSLELDELGVHGENRTPGLTFSERFDRGQLVGVSVGYLPFGFGPQKEFFGKSRPIGWLAKGMTGIGNVWGFKQISELIQPSRSKVAALQPYKIMANILHRADADRAVSEHFSLAEHVVDIQEATGKSRDQVIAEIQEVSQELAPEVVRSDAESIVELHVEGFREETIPVVNGQASRSMAAAHRVASTMRKKGESLAVWAKRLEERSGVWEETLARRVNTYEKAMARLEGGVTIVNEWFKAAPERSQNAFLRLMDRALDIAKKDTEKGGRPRGYATPIRAGTEGVQGEFRVEEGLSSAAEQKIDNLKKQAIDAIRPGDIDPNFKDWYPMKSTYPEGFSDPTGLGTGARVPTVKVKKGKEAEFEPDPRTWSETELDLDPQSRVFYLFECGSEKLPKKVVDEKGGVAAKDLYTSTRFKTLRELANEDSEDYLIVSGKHGFLKPDEVVDHYNVKMPKRPKDFDPNKSGGYTAKKGRVESEATRYDRLIGNMAVWLFDTFGDKIKARFIVAGSKVYREAVQDAVTRYTSWRRGVIGGIDRAGGELRPPRVDTPTKGLDQGKVLAWIRRERDVATGKAPKGATLKQKLAAKADLLDRSEITKRSARTLRYKEYSDAAAKKAGLPAKDPLASKKPLGSYSKPPPWVSLFAIDSRWRHGKDELLSFEGRQPRNIREFVELQDEVEVRRSQLDAEQYSAKPETKKSLADQEAEIEKFDAERVELASAEAAIKQVIESVPDTGLRTFLRARKALKSVRVAREMLRKSKERTKGVEEKIAALTAGAAQRIDDAAREVEEMWSWYDHRLEVLRKVGGGDLLELGYNYHRVEQMARKTFGGRSGSVMMLMSGYARVWAKGGGTGKLARNPDDWFNNIKMIQKGEGVKGSDGIIPRGNVTFEDGRAIITAFEEADITTFVHETAHVFRRTLKDADPELLTKAEQAMSLVPGAGWSRDAEEIFAEGFELYLMSGHAPTEGLRAVFERFQQWLVTIYHALVRKPNGGNANPELTDLFNEMLGGVQTKPNAAGTGEIGRVFPGTASGPGPIKSLDQGGKYVDSFDAGKPAPRYWGRGWVKAGRDEYGDVPLGGLNDLSKDAPRPTEPFEPALRDAMWGVKGSRRRKYIDSLPHAERRMAGRTRLLLRLDIERVSGVSVGRRVGAPLEVWMNPNSEDIAQMGSRSASERSDLSQHLKTGVFGPGSEHATTANLSFIEVNNAKLAGDSVAFGNPATAADGFKRWKTEWESPTTDTVGPQGVLGKREDRRRMVDHYVWNANHYNHTEVTNALQKAGLVPKRDVMTGAPLDESFARMSAGIKSGSVDAAGPTMKGGRGSIIVDTADGNFTQAYFDEVGPDYTFSSSPWHAKSKEEFVRLFLREQQHAARTRRDFLSGKVQLPDQVGEVFPPGMPSKRAGTSYPELQQGGLQKDGLWDFHEKPGEELFQVIDGGRGRAGGLFDPEVIQVVLRNPNKAQVAKLWSRVHDSMERIAAKEGLSVEDHFGIIVEQYGDNGFLKFIQDDAGNKYVWDWRYAHHYDVAKTLNAAFEEVRSVATTAERLGQIEKTWGGPIGEAFPPRIPRGMSKIWASIPDDKKNDIAYVTKVFDESDAWNQQFEVSWSGQLDGKARSVSGDQPPMRSLSQRGYPDREGGRFLPQGRRLGKLADEPPVKKAPVPRGLARLAEKIESSKRQLANWSMTGRKGGKKKGIRDLDVREKIAQEAHSRVQSPEEKQALRELRFSRELLLRLTVRSGVTKMRKEEFARLKPELLEYVERIMEPTAREAYKADATLREKIGNKVGHAAKLISESDARADEWRNLTIKEINDVFADYKGKTPIDKWFIDDFTRSLPMKTIGDHRSSVNAVFTHGVLDEFAVPHVPGETEPLLDVAVLAGLKEYKGVEIFAGGAQRKLEELGIPLGIPKDVAKEWLGVTDKFSSPEAWNKLVRAYDYYLRTMKWGLTVPWPSFQIRNLFTNVTLNWLGGVWNPKDYKRAATVMFKNFTDPRNTDLMYLKQLGVARGGWSRELMREIFGDTIEPTLIMKKLQGVKGRKFAQLSKKHGFTTRQFWSNVGAFVEDVSRSAHFYGRRRGHGDTVLEAVESVNKYLLDFGDLTDMERKYGRRIFLFYNWTRKMIPLMARQVFENPAKLASLARLTTLPSIKRPDYLPEYLRQTAALPWPDKFLGIPIGGSEPGETEYISGFGSPLEEVSKLDWTNLPPGITGKVGGFLERMLSQTAPPVRTFGELVAGKDFFYKKPISEADRAPYLNIPFTGGEYGLQKILPGATGYREEVTPGGAKRPRMDPHLLYGLRQTPVSRGIQEWSRLMDPRRSQLARWGQFLTGLRISGVNLATEEPRAKFRILKDRLSEHIGPGEVRVFEKLFATEAGKRNIELQKLLEYQTALGTQVRQQREAQTR